MGVLLKAFTALLLPNLCTSFLVGNKLKRNFAVEDSLSYSSQIYSSSSTSESEDQSPSNGIYTSGIHHTAIRTKDIESSIKFYSLLSFEVEDKYLIGGQVKAAWLQNKSTKLELIEVPEHVLGAPKELVRAADQMAKMNLLGLNHICLDVTESIRARQGMKLSRGSGGLNQWFVENENEDEDKNNNSESCAGSRQVDDYERNAEYGLQDWLLDLEDESKRNFGKTLRIALEPTSRTIGMNVYDIAYLYDPDGALVEVLNYVTSVKEGSIRTSWEVMMDDDFISMLKQKSS
eukprot:CAMPEP_0116072060 /NCGR_PEP_ID=MMETSP0322-20121206/14229_1 /TAXON_ID=163516 /ORGANISM="Leptocylindrus danicus var. apora, Strain B651" /LENGTH=289 /DNA_ID=CAMNT_0003560685 /DNA_START=180 /DNA_END=1049 /DNA_ORIENTATION=+